MATADQIKALLKSHLDNDEDRFISVALQVAAKEERQGHHKLAGQIKKLIEISQGLPKLQSVNSTTRNLAVKPKGDLQGLLEFSYPEVRKNELVLCDEVLTRLERVITEQRQKDRLSKFNLHPNRKLLFLGPPGTGKTMSAHVLATELKLPLYTIVLDNLITRFMGETAAKLRLVFDQIKISRAVYLFDEVDAIGSQRGGGNDVGEIRRVLNSFLMFVEQDQSESVLIAATNHPELLDKALYRRFDDIIEFEKPKPDAIKDLIVKRLISFNSSDIDWEKVINSANDLSAAEITRASEGAAKEAVLSKSNIITTELLVSAFSRRHRAKFNS